jgi:hypothetical protein
LKAVALKSRMIVEAEVEKMWKLTVLGCFKELSFSLIRGIDEYLEEP